MTKDPIIADIRKFRDKYARKHGYSIRAIAADLRRFQVPSSLHTTTPEAKRRRKCAI